MGWCPKLAQINQAARVNLLPFGFPVVPIGCEEVPVDTWLAETAFFAWLGIVRQSLEETFCASLLRQEWGSWATKPRETDKQKPFVSPRLCGEKCLATKAQRHKEKPTVPLS